MQKKWDLAGWTVWAVRGPRDVLKISATVMETEWLHRWLRGWGENIRGVDIEPT